ncbi:hypothetical protein U1Q18_022588 [Sarracenia purpurea var. burkii]
MEKLKSMVPKTLQRQIAESTTDDLPSTCSSLLDFFLLQSEFRRVVGELTEPETALCRKNKEAAMEWKSKGNECFSKGEYSKALSLYSQALRVAPTGSENMNKNLEAMLYVNRAFVLHAWYRRGKANASLENYQDAIRDLHIAKSIEPSLSGKRQIESELKLISNQQKGISGSMDKPNENNLGYFPYDL